MKFKNPFKKTVVQKGDFYSGMSLSSSDHVLGRLLSSFNTSSLTGENISVETAMRLGAVWACVSLISDSIAQLPLNVMVQNKNGSFEKSTEHPLNKVLRYKPNSFMTPADFKTAMACQMLTQGAFVAKPEFLGEEVTAINTFNHDVVPTYRAHNNRLIVNVGAAKEYDSSDLIVIRNFTRNGITPLSPIEQNAETIGVAKATNRHGANYFKNGALPGLKVTTPKALDDDQRAKLEKRYEEKYVGQDNAFKLMLLEAGFTAEPFQIKNTDAQFIESRKLNIEEICRIFRVPPHMVGHLERSTNNNITQQSLEYVKFVINHYLKRIEEGLQIALLPRDQWGKVCLKFNAEALLRGDLDARSNYYNRMVTGGIMTPNEARKKEDLPPLEGGDELRMQQQMIALSEIGANNES